MNMPPPIMVVLIDGLGDRGSPQLGGRTPLEAAHTPNLDILAGTAMTGLHLPFGWGRASSSEIAHWSIFGYEMITFPGRVVLEALGCGVEIPSNTPLFHVSLRPSYVQDGRILVAGRVQRDDADDARELLATVNGISIGPVQFTLRPLRSGEAVLVAAGASSVHVTDSDPFADIGAPWLQPQPLRRAPNLAAAAETAGWLTQYLQEARHRLVKHTVNRRRAERGLPTLDILATKWGGMRTSIPSFADYIGLRGAAVASSGLYAGFAALFGWHYVKAPPNDKLEADISARVALAADLLDETPFVYVHTKAADEAGHTKNPGYKRDVLEEIDAGLEQLLAVARRAVVVVTGDHATPSVGTALHSGDPTPVLIASPEGRPDAVREFGETACSAGLLGVVAARDLLPLALSAADRARFLGAHLSPWPTLAWPEEGVIPLTYVPQVE